MKKSELQQIIKEEISNILGEESKYPRDITDTNGSIVTTRDGKKYKILTTKPKEGSSDFYYDTIMKRVEQLDPEDWDVDVKTYKKAIPMSGELNEEDPLQTSFNKKVGMPEPSGAKNIMRPKSIEIEFSPNLKIQKILIDGTTNTEKGKDLIKQYTGLDASWNNTKSIAEKLRGKKINFSYSEVDRT